VPAFDPEEASFASCREDKRPGDYSPRIAERLHNAQRVVRAAAPPAGWRRQSGRAAENLHKFFVILILVMHFWRHTYIIHV